jgi:hypothetical protein
MALDYEAARTCLEEHFRQVEEAFRPGTDSPEHEVGEHLDALFASRTQAYREVLLGCTLAIIQDDSIDPSLPYVNQGDAAFNGRTLDERVVNPFLRAQQAPSSRGPYLSVFRRSVKINAATRDGVRDKNGYDALLSCVGYLNDSSEAERLQLLDALLWRFLMLREASSVRLMQIRRFSLHQYARLMERLIATPSGGRFPLFLVVATFRAIQDRTGANWDVEWQGINVADAASGAGGDVSIIEDGRTVLAAEITERIVDHARLTATFSTKIAPNAIPDYIFFITAAPDAATVAQAQAYFGQGHEVNFIEILGWIRSILATLGQAGREAFNQHLLELIGDLDVPVAAKRAWNEIVGALIG